MKKAIVSLSDKNYFEMTVELINSIKRFEESKDISICILDAGLSDEQKKIIQKKATIKKAIWDIEIPFYKKKHEWLKSQISRAFLPNYFPEFDRYLWIDADAWVNSWDCIDNYFNACANNKLGITQSIGPGYKVLANVKWLFKKLAIINSQNYKHAVNSGVKENEARKLAFAPHLNIGVFSLEKNSSIWSIWQNNLKKVLLKGRIFGSEGLAINLSVYIDNIETEFLPLSHNWIVKNLLPIYDTKENMFKEPYIPNNKIGIIHLAGGIKVDGKDMRTDKTVLIDIKDAEGNIIKKSLRYI